MKAEDTVKRTTSHSEPEFCPHCGEEFGIEDRIEYEREAQAEATWDAAEKKFRQEGRREVVEWVKEHSILLAVNGEIVRDMQELEWQDQQRKWGL